MLTEMRLAWRQPSVAPQSLSLLWVKRMLRRVCHIPSTLGDHVPRMIKDRDRYAYPLGPGLYPSNVVFHH